MLTSIFPTKWLLCISMDATCTQIFNLNQKSPAKSSRFCRQSTINIKSMPPHHRLFFGQSKDIKKMPKLPTYWRIETAGTRTSIRQNVKTRKLSQFAMRWSAKKKATAKKVLTTLSRSGHICSRSIIYHIARDLMYKWTKPWYTDILTAAQKYKRFLFVKWLLDKTPEELLQLLATYLWTDEKWWDIVGPECSDYVKAATRTETKLKNQVFFGEN